LISLVFQINSTHPSYHMNLGSFSFKVPFMSCCPFDLGKLTIMLGFGDKLLPLIFSEDQALLLSDCFEKIYEGLDDKCMRTFFRILRNLFNRSHILT